MKSLNARSCGHNKMYAFSSVDRCLCPVLQAGTLRERKLELGCFLKYSKA